MAIHGRPANAVTNLEDILSEGMNRIRKYISAIHDLIKDDGEKYKNAFNSKQVWTEEEDHDFWEAIDNLDQSGSFNPYFFNKSSIIIIFSFFEKLFKDLVNSIRAEKNLKIKIEDMNGRDIEKCYKYLQLIVDYDLTLLNTEWSVLMNYQTVRNLFVHQFGEITDDKKQKITDLVSSSTYLAISTSKNELLITDERYLTELCDTIELFLMKIAKDLR
jgi:hypothetical protein